MQEYGITRQKLFTLSRQTIEKRIRKFYRETKDGTATIELLIAIIFILLIILEKKSGNYYPQNYSQRKPMSLKKLNNY